MQQLNSNKRTHDQVNPGIEQPYKKQKNLLKQCPSCHQSLDRPLTLPCGYTCCKACHQEDSQCRSCNKLHTITLKPNVTLQTIQNISYDDTESKLDQALECAICCTRFTTPTTTPCGHTFCKKCLVRSLDHQHACPICRDSLDYCPPPTEILVELIQQLYSPEDSLEEDILERDDRIPLLIGSLAFPGVSCSVHIFEPRYKEMLRRVMQSSRRRFGLCLLKRKRSPGETSYYDYGTVLEMTHVQTLPDGRSIVEALGSHRFRVTRAELTDGYHMAEIERVDDLDSEQQLRLEQQQILRSSASRVKSHQPIRAPIRPVIKPVIQPTLRRSWAQQAHPQTQMNRTPWLQMHMTGVSAANPKPHKLQQQQQQQISTPKPTKTKEELTTDELVDGLVTFIQKLSQQPNHWLNSIGTLPPMDRANRDKIKLVWWITNMMPLNEEEKVNLLSMRTLRERTLMVTSWVTRFNDMCLNRFQMNTNIMPPIPCSTTI